jgi:hypothetical protein
MAAFLGIAAGQQLFEIGHHVPALGLGRLMATQTVGLEYGPDVMVITDFPARRLDRGRFFCRVALRRNKKSQRDCREWKPNGDTECDP